LPAVSASQFSGVRWRADVDAANERKNASCFNMVTNGEVIKRGSVAVGREYATYYLLVSKSLRSLQRVFSLIRISNLPIDRYTTWNAKSFILGFYGLAHSTLYNRVHELT
jgi:hypothetical protein